MSSDDRHAWSLAAELSLLEHALDGAAVLLSTFEEQSGGVALARRIVLGAEATVVLCNLRVRELGRALRGETPADRLRHSGNEVDPDVDDAVSVPGDTDVIFTPDSGARPRPEREGRTRR